MACERIKRSGSTLHTFDVVGQDSDAADSFVRHLGLANDDRENLSPGDRLQVTQMGPPLERGDGVFEAALAAGCSNAKGAAQTAAARAAASQAKRRGSSSGSHVKMLD